MGNKNENQVPIKRTLVQRLSTFIYLIYLVTDFCHVVVPSLGRHLATTKMSSTFLLWQTLVVAGRNVEYSIPVLHKDVKFEVGCNSTG